MLERTVAGLESCKLQRIIPQTSAQAQKSTHRLRTGFWQHGALAIELSHSWPVILEERHHEPRKDTRGGRSATRPIESELQSSAFRLDFLYPNVQIDKKRTRSSAKNEARPPGQRRCHYGTSREAYVDAVKSNTEIVHRDLEAYVASCEFGSPRDNANNPTPLGYKAGGRKNSEQENVPTTVEGDPVLSNRSQYSEHRCTRRPSTAEASEIHEPGPTARPTIMGRTSVDASMLLIKRGVKEAPGQRPDRKLDLDELLALSDPEGNRHLDVYDCFKRLDPDHRLRYRAAVLVALSKSGNVVARNRTEALIRQISEEDWTDDVLAAIVYHFMRKNERPVAVNYFKRGTMNSGLSGGLGPLLVDMFKTRFWSGALKIWEMWYEAQLKHRQEPVLDALKTVSALSKDLPGLYFSFEQYLASHRAHDLETGTLESTKPALAAFRRQFAELALENSSPKRAAVVLDFYKSSRLYNRYLEAMTQKWIQKEISRETARGLHKIYENYRQLDSFAPTEDVLRGMFEVYYPDAFKELDTLHDDWCHVNGELSAWAFNKYFKLHARLGNVAATRELLARQYKVQPTMDKDKGALRLMAVYARQGDVKAVRLIMRSFSSNSAKHFDHTIHHNLLVALIRNGQYGKALNCFDAMDDRGVLDSSDYSELMGMLSKSGDLDGTLHYLAAAQENNIDITPKMIHSVTIALIGNDRLRDAELVVSEMADQGVTSTEIWNELIKANGIVGNMPRCYGIVAVMKQRRIELLPSTYDEILASMVRYGQVAAANALLRDAEKHHSFPLSDEHYAIVMAGAVRLGDFGTAAGLVKRLAAFSHRPSFRTQVALLAAAIRGDSTLQNAKALAADVITSLQELYDLKAEAVLSHPADRVLAAFSGEADFSVLDTASQKLPRNRLVDVSPSGLRHATAKIGHAVALLTELRDQFSVEELISRYLDLHPLNSGELLPPSLMGSLLRAFYLDGEYRKAIEAWQQYWTQVLDKWVDPKTGLARPNKQYALMNLLEIVTNCLRELQNGEQLALFVSRVYVAGFKMSSMNWNTVIKSLAELGHLQSAMKWCEIILMPHWRGWQRFPDTKTHHTRQTSSFIRAINRAKLDYHFVRPHQETLLALQDKQRELLELSTWSSDKMALLLKIQEDNPRTGHALHKTPRGFLRQENKWRFGRGVSYESRIESFVQKLTFEEAEEMMQSLKQIISADILDTPGLAQTLTNEAMASKIHGSPESAKFGDAEAVEEPLAPEQKAEDEPVLATEPMTAEELAALEKKVQEKLMMDKEHGDAILALHMERWRTRTWKRNKWTRWDSHFLGWGDRAYIPGQET